MHTNDTAIAIIVDTTEEQEKKSCLPVVEFRLITIDASHYHSYEYTVINRNCNTPESRNISTLNYNCKELLALVI